MTIALISHSDCELHNMGLYHPEQPMRIKVIDEALCNSIYKNNLKKYQAPLAKIDQLRRVHTNTLIEAILSSSPKEGLIAFAPDVYMNPHSVTAALRAAGAAILGVDLVMNNEMEQAFCNVRPPGHHAEHDNAMGFCFFNNVAVATVHAFDKYRLKRIAIVDFDVHHGNGIEDIFRSDNRVLYCSSFQYPFYPFGDPDTNNTHIINIPLKAGTDSKLFRQKTEYYWFQKIRLFRPELIFFSAGFDGYYDDEIADLLLTEDDYLWLTTKIKEIATECCQGRIVSVLEGGYSLKGLVPCSLAHIQGLLS